MKAIAIDIKESVFDNETEALLYVIKDVYEAENTFVFSIPVYTFSWDVKTEKDFEALKSFNIFGSEERRNKLIAEMKRAMSEFE
jgi:hypothetical protein